MKAKHLTLIAALGIYGCKAHQDPLEESLRQLKRETQIEVIELEPIIDVSVSRYATHQVRQPFELPKAATTVGYPEIPPDCWQPKSNNKAALFEQVPLSKLRLKGVLSHDRQISALVEAPSGQLVRVKAGQYLGLHHGKVTQVSTKHVLVQQILPDGLGCWQQRNVTLALK